jgi:hypothetical protein
LAEQVPCRQSFIREQNAYALVPAYKLDEGDDDDGRLTAIEFLSFRNRTSAIARLSQ